MLVFANDEKLGDDQVEAGLSTPIDEVCWIAMVNKLVPVVESKPIVGHGTETLPPVLIDEVLKIEPVVKPVVKGKLELVDRLEVVGEDTDELPLGLVKEKAELIFEVDAAPLGVCCVEDQDVPD